MVKFVCNECNYRFDSDKDQAGRKCPYCGKPTVVKEPSAEDLIDEL